MSHDQAKDIAMMLFNDLKISLGGVEPTAEVFEEVVALAKIIDNQGEK